MPSRGRRNPAVRLAKSPTGSLMFMLRSKVWIVPQALLLLVLLSGCGLLVSREPAPEVYSDYGSPMGIPNVRAWGDTASPLFQRRLQEAAQQRKAMQTQEDSTVSYLALSGGGADGAFGTGVLCGWTERGDRPQFRVVTGVSTGALVAPFAFLGSEYDGLIQKMYTNITADDIFFLRSIFKIVAGDALADTSPLARTVNNVVDENVLKAVAREHNKGRHLLIATTNLDAKRSVIWNMGAIAVSGHPNALELFRRVMQASASIPVFFNPVYIPIETARGRYDEMHVDGGTVNQFFAYEAFIHPQIIARLLASEGEQEITRNLYILINNRLQAKWEPVPPLLKDIASTSISTLIRSQAMGSLYKAYLHSKRDGVHFNMMSIPTEGYPEREEEFDKVAMRVLFSTGRKLILAKEDPWQHYPPGYIE